MNSHFFAYISRMRLIRRWSLMHSNSPENIQEHSYRVALLAHALANIGNIWFEKKYNPEKSAFLALLHDAGEVITGDVPTPVKYFDATIREAFQGIEKAANQCLLSLLPTQLQKVYEPALFPQEEDGECWRLIRAADKLCAWLKCLEERCGGNRDFLSAEEALRSHLDRLCMEEVDFFIEHFAPGFTLSLDELGRNLPRTSEKNTEDVR